MLAFSALAFPEIDPVLLSIGPLAIRWYSLAYIAGILLGWWYVKRLVPKTACAHGVAISPSQLDDLVVWVIFGVVLGGRTGYVLFYQFGYYLSNPLDIFMLWHGGMSFHGGFLGVLTAVWLFARKHKLMFFRIMDVLACATPFGLFFGRIANFINGELFGRVTDVPWAVLFPAGGYLPRHPSQLYEAVLEGLVLFAVLAFLVWRKGALLYPRLLSGVFLMGYGLSRIVVECAREPDAQLGFLFGGWLTMGMLLSVPMVLVGVVLVRLGLKHPLPKGA